MKLRAVLRTALVAMSIVTTGTAMAQGDYFGLFDLDTTPFSDQDKSNEFVNVSEGQNKGQTGNAFWALNCTRQYGIESVRHKSTGVPRGLYSNVAAQVRAQSPRATMGQRVGNYNGQFSDANKQWRAERAERMAEQRRQAAEKKRMEELARQIADDNLAAAVTAQTNAMLQQRTNQAIARDHWHANQGAQQAQQIGRAAHKMQGPQLASAQRNLSNAQRANMMRQRPKLKPQVARRQLTPIRRTAQITPQQRQAQRLAMQRKAEYVAKQRELVRRRNEALARAKAARRAEIMKKFQTGNEIVAIGRSQVAFRLSQHATSSLGQDWHTVSLKTPRIPEYRSMKADDWHRLVVIECIDNRELTPAEKAYYDSRR